LDETSKQATNVQSERVIFEYLNTLVLPVQSEIH